MKNQILLLCLLLSFRAFSQAPVSETIHVNSVEAKVWSNGALFGWNNERSFKVPVSDENDSVRLQVFNRVVPWICGFDDFGNMKMAAIRSTGTISDFAPGVLNAGGYDLIWTVTKADIMTHRADFQDNGVIDNPVSAIMAWPGTLMMPPYSQGSSPLLPTPVAPFMDVNFNNIYDPLSGDFPLPDIGSPYFLPGIPDKILCFAFHDKEGNHQATGGKFMDLQFFCTVWAYSCPEQPAFNNSIFMSMEYWNRGSTPLDSLYFGLLLNFEIGNGNDDFIGCIPDNELEIGSHTYFGDKIFYGYNGDPVDQNGFETTPPVVGVFPVGRKPPGLLSINEPFFMRVGNSAATTPPGMAYPITSGGFHRYLIGNWTDGTPLRSGGNGYHPQDTSQAVHFIFPGDPTVDTTWSEPAAGSVPDLRRALISYKCPRMNPGNRQKRSFCFTWARNVKAEAPLKAAIDQIRVNEFFLNQLAYYKPSFPVSTPSCISWEITSMESPASAFLTVSPNPSTGVVHILSSKNTLIQITLTDLSGKILYHDPNLHTSELDLDLPLPAGLYFLTVITDDNKRLTQKLFISR